MPKTLAPSSEDPPRTCPSCGADLSEYPYYHRIPSRWAQSLYRLGRLSLVVMVAFTIHSFATDKIPTFSHGHGIFVIAAAIVLPATIFYSLGSILPRHFRVICLRCSWFRDYAFRRRMLEARGR